MVELIFKIVIGIVVAIVVLIVVAIGLVYCFRKKIERAKYVRSLELDERPLVGEREAVEKATSYRKEFSKKLFGEMLAIPGQDYLMLGNLFYIVFADNLEAQWWLDHQEKFDSLKGDVLIRTFMDS